jgi:hypothetical protein
MAGPDHFPLLAIGILRAFAEVALLCLAGRGILALLAGARRQDNPVYRLFVLVTHPALRLARVLAPPQIIDRHLPVVAFFLLLWLWIGLAWLKKHYCAAQHLACF